MPNCLLITGIKHENVPLPKEKKPIGSMRIPKTKDNGLPKARVVVHGNHQIEGLIYKEIFAPTIRFTSLRFALAVASKFGLK